MTCGVTKRGAASVLLSIWSIAILIAGAVEQPAFADDDEWVMIGLPKHWQWTQSVGPAGGGELTGHVFVTLAGPKQTGQPCTYVLQVRLPETRHPNGSRGLAIAASEPGSIMLSVDSGQAHFEAGEELYYADLARMAGYTESEKRKGGSRAAITVPADPEAPMEDERPPANLVEALGVNLPVRSTDDALAAANILQQWAARKADFAITHDGPDLTWGDDEEDMELFAGPDIVFTDGRFANIQTLTWHRLSAGAADAAEIRYWFELARDKPSATVMWVRAVVPYAWHDPGPNAQTPGGRHIRYLELETGVRLPAGADAGGQTPPAAPATAAPLRTPTVPRMGTVPTTGVQPGTPAAIPASPVGGKGAGRGTQLVTLTQADVAMANDVFNANTRSLPGFTAGARVRRGPGPLSAVDTIVLMALKYRYEVPAIVPFPYFRDGVARANASPTDAQAAEGFWAWYEDRARRTDVGPPLGLPRDFNTYATMKVTAREAKANRQLGALVAGEEVWRRVMEQDRAFRDSIAKGEQQALEMRAKYLQQWSDQAQVAEAARESWVVYLSTGAGHMDGWYDPGPHMRY